MYIIVEYLFIENFIINYVILQITKIITRTKVRRSRIFITAAIAAFYPFVLFFPSIIFLTNFYMKIIISIIIIKLAYNSKSISLYLKQLSAFYIISFVFAGASIGTYYFTNSYNNILFKSNFKGGFSIKYLLLGVLLGGIMIKNTLSYYQEKMTREQELLEVSVYLNNNKACFISLIDTGNSLIEPLSKLPVMVVEYKIIKNLLPLTLTQIFELQQENDFITLGKVIENLRDEIKIRLIPFKSIGSNEKFLIGFKPDYIKVFNGNSESMYYDVIIGIFNDRLCTDEQYNGLLNSEILNRGSLCVDEN